MPASVRAAAAALLLAALGCASAGPGAPPPPAAPEDAGVPRIEWGLVMHGGAGTITPSSMTPELERQYRQTMEEAMRAGHAVLRGGGGSLDAVVAAINILEDSPLFNAGKGAVFTAEGTNSMDASIMYGPTLAAGAVAGVTRVRNPIDLARLVMEQSPHVMLIGEGADTFAASVGLEQVDPAFFFTERRWRGLESALRNQNQPIPARRASSRSSTGPVSTYQRDCASPLLAVSHQPKPTARSSFSHLSLSPMHANEACPNTTPDSTHRLKRGFFQLSSGWNRIGKIEVQTSSLEAPRIGKSALLEK